MPRKSVLVLVVLVVEVCLVTRCLVGGEVERGVVGVELEVGIFGRRGSHIRFSTGIGWCW